MYSIFLLNLKTERSCFPKKENSVVTSPRKGPPVPKNGVFNSSVLFSFDHDCIGNVAS
jgi:hypothetical protein